MLTLQELQIPFHFNMYLVINKCITTLILENFSCCYLSNHSTLEIGVFGYIDVILPKERPPQVWQITHETLSMLN